MRPLPRDCREETGLRVQGCSTAPFNTSNNPHGLTAASSGAESTGDLAKDERPFR